MSERKASMGDKVYRGDVVKYIRNNISLDTFMKRTVQKADESCWDLCDKLNFVPAIEDEQPERKSGKWIEDAETYYKAVNEKGGGVNENTPYFTDDIGCPECLSMFSVINNETERFDFCPVCGADMRGDSK